MELLQGFRSKAKMTAVKKNFEMRQTQRLPLTSTITEHALDHGLTLLTGNAKHFAPIEQMKIERFEP
jgi:hypothetical protein